MHRFVVCAVLSAGCTGLFPTVPASPEAASPVRPAPAAPPPATEIKEAPEPSSIGAADRREAPTATQQDLALLGEFIGTYEFGECEGESLGGDAMCWAYGIKVEVGPGSDVIARIDGGGYQTSPYTIHATTWLAPADRQALALKFAGYSDDTEEFPSEFAAGDLLGVLAKRNGTMCFAFAKLQSATGAKYLCK